MKILPLNFISNEDRSGDNEFTQFAREKNVAIYQRRKESKTIGYEVFMVRVIKAGSKLPGGGCIAEDYERYPTKNDFGKTAWFCTENTAFQKFDELVKQNA